ncbi:protein ECT2 isoform X4 [Eurytemora carolleeae]|uniref:protein ECT2 isoform X4 n=1 Tax=Eurytemora carolleeae TaxID=1294199 RepID=UPI000C764691|nr:protein ECT2 isoform X4 [Eurytemora carolleeae]|eukprot:XP_023320077.1 protein ECT2-like isoform X4 [Eurytemora affinis]
MSESHLEDHEVQLCLIGEELRRDASIVKTCQSFQRPVHYSTDGSDWVDEDNVITVFVVSSFRGEIFERLQNEKRHILGIPALKDLANSGHPILVKNKPVYCLALLGCRIIFSGYRHKSDLDRLLKLVHTMGGSVIRDVGRKVTHVVAKASMGDKYNYATTFSLPVITEDWLQTAWDNRENLGFSANTKEMHEKYKLPPFAGNVVCFYGFDQGEVEHMTEILVANGGRVAEGGVRGCEAVTTTHMVVDENNVDQLPTDIKISDRCCVVRGEWFWNSIQIQAAADVSSYMWRATGVLSPSNRSLFSPPTPSSVGASRKRKRLRRAEVINALATDSPAHKRRSSISELGLLSMSGSFLDSTDRNLLSPEPERGAVLSSVEREGGEPEAVISIPVFNLKTATPRQQVFHELVTTESNYVGILDCVTKISEEAEDPCQQGGALLDQQEMKIIFGNLPPIRKVHTDMLKRLKELEANWSEEACIGTIILDCAGDLLKAYPPFVNFFERTKEQIQDCDRRNPRFHAFLKKCERRIECSRQTLTELMIRPVQRLPSMSLLLNDLLKHTKRGGEHRDIELLEQAIAKVKNVMTHLNEEKRRTEGQIHIFDIYSEIDNCPASVVSSHRSFVCRAECFEVAAADVLCGKGYELTLFLFTDILLIAKKKTGKIGGMLRSPSTTSIASGQINMQTKALKFVTLIHLSAVRRLVDILDTADTESGVIAFVCRQTEDLRERCYTFQLLTETNEEKVAFLRTICRHVANTLCRPDSESLLVRLEPRDMSLEASDLNVSTLSRTFSSLYKTKQKVGRAFSFNRTPGKLKRAVSTMISPITSSSTLRTDGFSRTLGRNQKTPSDSLRELKLETGGRKKAVMMRRGSLSKPGPPTFYARSITPIPAVTVCVSATTSTPQL